MLIISKQNEGSLEENCNSDCLTNVSLSCCQIKMDISLGERAGNSALSENVLRSLVTHADQDAERLAELARPYSYVGGAALGVMVGINSDTGEVTGSRFKFFGEDKPKVYVGQVKGRQLWGIDVAKEMKVDFSIGVRNPKGPNELTPLFAL